MSEEWYPKFIRERRKHIYDGLLNEEKETKSSEPFITETEIIMLKLSRVAWFIAGVSIGFALRGFY